MSACRGKLCLGATMPLAFALFGKSQPGRFFAGPTLALDVGGGTAWLAGHANPEELAGFLAFCGCEAVVLDEAECPPPTGWKRAKTHSVFGLAPGRQLPLPEQTLPSGRVLPKTQNLPPEKQRICSSLTGPQNGTTFTLSSAPSARPGLARVWTLERGREHHLYCGSLRAGKWSGIHGCGETVEALRGKGVGGRLIVEMANCLAQVDACLPVQPRAGAFLYPAGL